KRDNDDGDEDEDDRPAPRAKKKSTSPGVIIAAVGGGVALLAGLVVVVILLVNRESDKPTPVDILDASALKTKGPIGNGPPPGVGRGGMMGAQGGPPAGMMGKQGGMQGGEGHAAPDAGALAEARRIENAIQVAKQLDPVVRKKIEDATVYIEFKYKEKDAHP